MAYNFRSCRQSPSLDSVRCNFKKTHYFAINWPPGDCLQRLWFDSEIYTLLWMIEWRKPGGTRSLLWCKKLRKQWGWWQRWRDKCMKKWTRTRLRGWWTKSGSWFQRRDDASMSEWAISDFQWGDDSWSRKGDNRWGADTARWLNRDQVVKIVRLRGSKNFVVKTDREVDIWYVQYLKPMQRSENGSDMSGSGNLNNSTSKKL